MKGFILWATISSINLFCGHKLTAVKGFFAKLFTDHSPQQEMNALAVEVHRIRYFFARTCVASNNARK